MNSPGVGQMAGHEGDGLRVGAASVEITPPIGTHLAGDVGGYRPARSVEDEILATSLMLESHGKVVCIISADLTIISGDFSRRVREMAKDELGLDPDAVMVHATQSHSAPAIGSFILSDGFRLPEEFDWLHGSEREYSSWATERMEEAVRRSYDELKPAEIGWGRGIEGRMAFNRRAVMRDGTVSMPGRMWTDPLGPTGILHLEGPIDPEVGVVCFRGTSVDLPSMIVSYTCHPVHVFPKPIVSADWPGSLRRGLKRSYGGTCTPMVLNGCCGNINPWPPYEPNYVESHARMGEVLCRTATRVIDRIEFDDGIELGWRSRKIGLPIREIDEGELREAEELLERQPEPVWTEGKGGVDPRWVMAAGLIDLNSLRSSSTSYEYEIQAFRIGQIAVVGLPGEPFVEGQLRIKERSPADLTIVAHDTGHYAGYLPTREAYPRGGHETRTGNWSRFAPGSLERVVDEVIDILEEMFR